MGAKSLLISKKVVNFANYFDYIPKLLIDVNIYAKIQVDNRLEKMLNINN